MRGRRLSRELHDGIGHALTDTKLDLAWLDRRLRNARPPSARTVRTRIGAVGRRVDQMAMTVRDMATALRPAILDALGLKAAIEWSVRDFGRRTGLACTLDLPEALPTLDSEPTIGMFRALQEILTNVAKHAQAESVVVSLSVIDDRLIVRVADDGRGFDVSAPHRPGALGLIGLKERISGFGGRIAIDSAPGRGTGGDTDDAGLEIMTRRSSAKLAFLVSEDHPSTRLGIKRILLDGFPGSVIGGSW